MVQIPILDHNNIPLHIAAFCGFTDLAKLLIKFNANVNAKNRRGEIPLHSAVYRDRYEMARILHDIGADPNICDLRQDNSIETAFKWKKIVMAKLILYNQF